MNNLDVTRINIYAPYKEWRRWRRQKNSQTPYISSW